MLAVVLVWFEPQQLLVRTRVDEPLPAPARAPADRPATDPAVRVLARGELVWRAHPTVGTVTLLELADGRRLVRLEGLRTTSGPDLRVYFSAAGIDQDPAQVINLGPLKGNEGNPERRRARPSRSRRAAQPLDLVPDFAVGFGAAPLGAP
jgi:hypothetical protein